MTSKQATCPEYSTERVIPGALRARHVSRDLTPGEPRMLPECATCPAWKIPGSEPWMTSECDTCPEPLDHPGTARQRHEGIPGRPPRTLGEYATCPGSIFFSTDF